MIDRDSPISLYYQIAVDLRQRIARGEWRLGQQLPAEIDLAQAYHVSRMTLRQALAYLENEGILARQRGIGTFIRGDPKKVGWGLNTPISFTRQMRELGYTPLVKMISARVINSLAPENEAMACFERLFYANGRPVALSRSRLPERLCPGIVERGLVNDSLTTTLEKIYGLVPARVDQWLKAKNVSVEEAGWLEIEAGTAVLEIHTRSVLEDGTQFEYAQTLCVGERLSLHIHFSAGGESSPNQIEYVMPASL